MTRLTQDVLPGFNLSMIPIVILGVDVEVKLDLAKERLA